MASYGGMESGGGIGVLCKNGPNETLQLLDIWEAENVYQFGTPKDHGSIDRNVTQWEREWTEAQGGIYDPHLYDIKKQVTRIFVPVSIISLTNDFSTWRALPVNCQYIQIAKFIDPPNGTKLEDLWDKSKIQIVMSLYRKLDNVNKAALLLHEFNYFGIRFQANGRALPFGSDDARIWVAAEATGNSKLVAPMAPASTVCNFTIDGSNEFIHHFYAQNEFNYDGIRGVRFYFAWINGYVLPLKATFFVPGLSEADLQSGFLSAPIDINVSYDVKFPNVTLQLFKIRLQRSGDSKKPLKLIPLDSNNNMIVNGECR